MLLKIRRRVYRKKLHLEQECYFSLIAGSVRQCVSENWPFDASRLHISDNQ